MFALSVVCFAGLLALSARHAAPFIGLSYGGGYDEATETEAAATTEPGEVALSTQSGMGETVRSEETSAYEPTTAQASVGDEQALPEESAPAAAQNDAPPARRSETVITALSFVLLLLGIGAGAGFALLAPFGRPLTSPAIDVMALGGCVAALSAVLDTEAISPYSVFAGALLFAAALLAAKELISWAFSRFSFRFSLLARLAERAERRSGKALTALVVSGVGIAAVCFVLSVFFTAQSVPLGYFGLIPITPLLAAGLFLYFAVRAAVKLVRSLSHLTAQIGAARQGTQPEIGDGWFSADEQALTEIDRAREEAVRSAVRDERFRAELITNVSHDLRTPLTSVLGYAELLKKENLSPEGEAELNSLCLKAGYLRDMIEDLFQLAKVTAGEAEQKRETLDIVKLLEQTLGLLDDGIAQKDLQLRRHYEADAVPVVSDGAMLHRVFDNLVGNAVKYSPVGARIHLYVSLREENVTVRVVNTANYEMDFDVSEITGRFVRGDKARSTQGSGLGLSIAKAYTEAVGGSLRLTVDGDQFSAAVTVPTENRQKNPR